MLSDVEVKRFIDDHLRHSEDIYALGRRLAERCFDELYHVINNDPDLPEINKLYEHKNGTVYKVIAIANHTISPFRKDEYPTTIIYRNINTLAVYSRPFYRWKDSFTLIETK